MCEDCPYADREQIIAFPPHAPHTRINLHLAHCLLDMLGKDATDYNYADLEFDPMVGLLCKLDNMRTAGRMPSAVNAQFSRLCAELSHNKHGPDFAADIEALYAKATE